MISKAIKYLWMGMALLWIVGCYGDDSYMYRSYCESNVCKPSTDVLQRPTSFALELQLNDSANYRMAKLYTLDCKYLADEDTAELSTFCVDSLKYGKSDSLRNLPQKSKYSYDQYSTLYVKDDGNVLEKYARIPIDDDDHLRFTLVDRKNKKKAFDLDLSVFLKMYELHGDTFDFKFPDSTVFEAFSRDTTFSEKDCDVPFTSKREYECYEYSLYDKSYMDTTVYCIMNQGDSYENISSYITTAEFWAVGLSDIGDSSACKSQRFYAQIIEQKPRHLEVVGCYRIDLASVPDTLSLSNLYSRRLMNDAIVDSLGERVYRWSETQPDSSLITGHRHPWHAVTRLSEQGPDGEDEFTVYTIYKD
jgi:hypothetical protein